MNENDPKPSTLGAAKGKVDRHERQWRYAPIGREGQAKIAQSTVLIAGVGALGSVAAELLARAGVGRLRIVDRDFPEWNNLQRQSLYDEADVLGGLPKAIAAAERLRRIDSSLTIEPIVGDLRFDTIPAWLDGVDAIVDGTDNFETRFLLNDASLERGIPWVFAGCLGAEGQSMTIVPHRTPCLRCLMPEGPPAVGETPTCDTAGILGSIIHVMASIEVTEVLKLLVGAGSQVNRHLTVVDLWSGSFRRLDLSGLKQGEPCPACDLGRREWLDGTRAPVAAVLCGRNAVQIRGTGPIDPVALAAGFAPERVATVNRFLVRLAIGDYLFTIFSDGRIVVGGTEDPVRARALASQHLGL